MLKPFSNFQFCVNLAGEDGTPIWAMSGCLGLGGDVDLWKRVHVAQKDDEMLPVESIIAPLETELKLATGGILLFCNMTTFYFKTDRAGKNLCSIFVTKLQDDNRTLDLQATYISIRSSTCTCSYGNFNKVLIS
ncbi:hypothetical protein ACFX1Q_000118 [Malus domestica]|uniref:Uncharacterized protein n=1 Tax=Malus domestica TaxID=3750 RepID=A0A498KX45_MALDO|nr:hypothetical protein DVH24_034110 [Malus domestica]